MKNEKRTFLRTMKCDSSTIHIKDIISAYGGIILDFINQKITHVYQKNR